MIPGIEEFLQGNSAYMILPLEMRVWWGWPGTVERAIHEQEVDHGITELGLILEQAVINLFVESIPPWGRQPCVWYSSPPLGAWDSTTGPGAGFDGYILTPTRWPGVYFFAQDSLYEGGHIGLCALVRAPTEWFAELLVQFEACKHTIHYMPFDRFDHVGCFRERTRNMLPTKSHLE